MGEKNITPRTITRGREIPSLDPGPQRLHYQFSVSLPLTHLTFVSVLQGVVLSNLLDKISLPPGDASWESLFTFSFRHYFYLPYIISSLLILLIWIQFVHASLFFSWPLSVIQSGLFLLLTICEVLTFQRITAPTLSPWLFGIGCISIVGGFIRIHNVRWYKRTAKPRYQHFFDAVQPLIHFAQRDGWFYMGGGIILVVISHTLLFLPLVSWITLVSTLTSLLGCVWLYTKFRQLVMEEMAQNSDLKVLKHGSIRYKTKPLKLSDKESDHEANHLQDRTQLRDATSKQHYSTHQQNSTLQWKRLLWMLKAGIISLILYVIGNWIFHRVSQGE